MSDIPTNLTSDDTPPSLEPVALKLPMPVVPTIPTTIDSGGTPQDVVIPPYAQENFPKGYNWLAAAPILAAVMSFIVGENASSALITIPFELLALIAIIILYKKQVPYIRKVYPAKNLKPQLVLPLAAVAIITGAVAFGDISGASHFNDHLSGPLSWLGGTVAGAAVGVMFSYVFVLHNIVYIAHRGGGGALRIVGQIFYGIGWLITAAITYVAYAFAYSSHDPSSE